MKEDIILTIKKVKKEDGSVKLEFDIADCFPFDFLISALAYEYKNKSNKSKEEIIKEFTHNFNLLLKLLD